MANIEKMKELRETVKENRTAHEDRLADILQDEIIAAEVDPTVSVGRFLEQLVENTSFE